MRAAAYVRISQDRDGTAAGVERQEEDARALAERRGWELVAVHRDNDLSAAGHRKRPGFEAVIASVEARDVGAIIAWDLTRLTRNARDRLRLIEAGRAAGTVVALVRGSDMDLSTPAGRLTADILASVAQHEIEQKSDRQRRAVLQAAQAGRWIGGRRPFGYDADGITQRPDEAQAVRGAYGAFLAGEPLGAIARDLNHNGHRTGQGGPWTSSNVRDMLANPRYAGLRGHGSVPERGRRTIDVVGKAEWSPVVSEQTWRAVAATLTDPSRRTAPRSGRALLTGIAVCGRCGAHVVGGRITGADYRTIRCSATPGHIARRADPVEDYVSRVIVARLARPDAAELLIDQDRPDVEQLRAEAAAIRARIAETDGLWTRGALTTARFERVVAELRALLTDAEARIADAGRVNVLGPLVGAQDVHAAWDLLSLDRRRAVIDVLAHVVVHPPGRGRRTFDPATVRVEWRTS
ncbi:MAG: recombinase family protein [Kineosporiaceae bacterium]